MQSFIDSRDILDNGAELQKRMEQDGYLFISGLLPGETVEHLRLKQLKIGLEEGWVSADAPLQDGVADLNGFGVEPEPEYARPRSHDKSPRVLRLSPAPQSHRHV